MSFDDHYALCDWTVWYRFGVAFVVHQKCPNLAIIITRTPNKKVRRVLRRKSLQKEQIVECSPSFFPLVHNFSHSITVHRINKEMKLFGKTKLAALLVAITRKHVTAESVRTMVRLDVVLMLLLFYLDGRMC
jgi:hypothetical protein